MKKKAGNKRKPTDRPTPWNVPNLLSELHAIYASAKKDPDAWEGEKDSLKKQLLALSTSLHRSYQNPSVLARGGSGILLKVQDVRLHMQERVLKFPRPLAQNAPEFAQLLDNEIKLLASTRCRSIVTIHEAGKVELDEQIAGLDHVPFYVMDYVSGENSASFLEKKKISFHTFLQILHETVKAINHLHTHEIVHLDIKPANILIDDSMLPVLVDLGTTKRISQDDSQTKIACTLHYAPRELRLALADKPSDPSRAEGAIKRSQIKLSWDLHALGLTFQEWIASFLRTNLGGMTPYQRKYLLLISVRMIQDPYGPDIVREYGLEVNFLESIRYEGISTPLRDIEKILPGKELATDIPEFDQNFHKTIQVAVGESTAFTERLRKTLDHPFIRRLAEVSHLGIVQLVYPTCTHTRLEHTLGTYHHVLEYIRALYCDPLNPIFRQIMEPEDLRAALLSALLHDIGQFPMAHDFEDVDKQLFNHKHLVRALIKGIRDEKQKGTKRMLFPSLDEIFDLWGVKRDNLLSILEAKINEVTHGTRQRILKSLISGPIDADKLDYLLRDSRRLGVPYPEGIDVERLLRCLTLVVKDHANGVLAYVGVHEKGKIPAEFVTVARYAMFGQVYWHHAVRGAKAMLTRAVCALVATLSDEEKRNGFKSDFERFVLFGIAESIGETAMQQDLFVELPRDTSGKPVDEKGVFETKFSGTALNSWDIATLKFIRKAMEDSKLPEVELIDDILGRSLYKRIFVFNAERDKHLWDGFIAQWDKLGCRQRVEVMQGIERSICEAAGQKLSQDPDTIYLTEDQRQSMEVRVSAGLPLILIDVPADKPGSHLPMEYVLEEDRRELRRSNRICGGSCVDKAWEEYAGRLREKAGKIRIYVHPSYVDSVRSAVDKAWMGEILEDLSAYVEKTKE
jgi:HD superfamily phosphohydrolase